MCENPNALNLSVKHHKTLRIQTHTAQSAARVSGTGTDTPRCHELRTASVNCMYATPAQHSTNAESETSQNVSMSETASQSHPS